MPSLLTPDSGLLFWMLLSFLIVFFILSRYGFPVIIKMVEERKQYIDESLQNARNANERLAKTQAESQNIIKEAREQQALILKEAMETRENIIKEARIKAIEEGNKLLNDAKAQIQAEKDLAMHDIRSQVVTLSVNIAEKILKKDLSDDKKQSDYIEEILNSKAL